MLDEGDGDPLVHLCDVSYCCKKWPLYLFSRFVSFVGGGSGSDRRKGKDKCVVY